MCDATAQTTRSACVPEGWPACSDVALRALSRHLPSPASLFACPAHVLSLLSSAHALDLVSSIAAALAIGVRACMHAPRSTGFDADAGAIEGMGSTSAVSAFCCCAAVCCAIVELARLPAVFLRRGEWRNSWEADHASSAE
jgi:hypothetical protein